MKVCHACKAGLSLGRAIGRRDECPFCRVDLRCCLNCTFYDRVAPKQCREPAAELVKDKNRSTYCDFFAFAEAPLTETRGEEAENSRKALEDLFKKER